MVRDDRHTVVLDVVVPTLQVERWGLHPHEMGSACPIRVIRRNTSCRPRYTHAPCIQRASHCPRLSRLSKPSFLLASPIMGYHKHHESGWHDIISTENYRQVGSCSGIALVSTLHLPRAC